MARFQATERKEGIDASVSTTTPSHRTPPPKSGSQSVIAESQARSSGTILSDKPRTCESGILMLKSSKTLAQESISNGKDCGPYWNEQCAELSSRLWLPTETVLQDSEARSSSLLFNSPVENSWFLTRFHSRPSKNSLPTCLPSFTSFPVDCTDSESTGLRSRKIRIYPDFEQRRILRHWFGVSRYVYNKTIEYLKEPGTKANWMEIKLWLLKDLPEWCDGVPFQVKAIAVRDACQAVKNAKARWKRERKYSEVKYRSKKNPSQTIFIPKSAMNPTKGPYYTMLGEMHFSEVVPAPQGDCRLTYRSGRWFVTVPVETATKTAESQGRVVSIDPGVRTFATFYSPDCCGKIGTGDFSRIQRLCFHLDDLISRTRTEKDRNRRNRMKKAQARMRWKIRDLIDELHHKAALFFVRNFDVILIPKFETSQMSRRGYRKIRAKSVRSMLTFAHYRFQEFLKFKAWEYDKVVVHVNEAYTSKTCSWNGKIKKIGGAKFIRDNGVVVDRDYNGARGIFLRGLCEIQPSLDHERCTTDDLMQFCQV